MTPDLVSLLPEEARGTEHFGIAYGLGVDSTAILVELVRRRLRPDFILFADVGSEKESTYRFLPVIQEYLAGAGFPPVTVVRYEAVRSPYSTKEDSTHVRSLVCLHPYRGMSPAGARVAAVCPDGE